MRIRRLCIGLVAALLCACASGPPPAVPQGLWRDAVFADPQARVTVDEATLFALPPALHAQLQALRQRGPSRDRRLAALVALLIEPGHTRFEYDTHSTVAAETWQRRKGDCLSLTVLAQAMGEALGLPVHMQEVPVAVSYDRRGPLDYVSLHVNLFVKSGVERDLSAAGAVTQGTVIDFEPQAGAAQRSRELSRQQVLARYYNNLATEHLAAHRPTQAYAHFKAALAADPDLGAAWNNLALLYQQSGLHAEAEQLLRQAIARDDRHGVALQALARLLQDQGRGAEAQALDTQLQALREQDPDHWIALGLQQLRAGNFTAAVQALRRAESLASGFAELHQYLAVAYWRLEQPALAQQQLDALARVRHDAHTHAALSHKIRQPPTPVY